MDCQQCKSPSSLFCDCITDVHQLCTNCFLKHHTITSPSTQSGNSQTEDAPCTLCDKAAKVMCLACMNYECEECCLKNSNEENCDYYPIHLSQYLSQNRGEQRVRDGKKINKAIVFMKSLVEPAVIRAKAEVDSKFVALAETLEKCRLGYHSKIDMEAAKLTESIQTLEEQVHLLKYTADYTPTTRLEKLLLESYDLVLSELKTETWLVVNSVDSVLRQFTSSWLKIGNMVMWFERAETDCPWVNRFVPLLYNPIKFLDLETCIINQCEFKLFFGGGGSSFIQLPSGEYFIVKGKYPAKLFLINNQYSGFREIGTLAAHRTDCGLANVDNLIYIFGGSSSEDVPTTTVQSFNLHTFKAVICACQMNEGRELFTPSVLNGHVYILGGMKPDGEIFDPPTMTFRMIPISLSVYGPTITLVFSSTEIIILSGIIYSFNPETEEVFRLTQNKTLFLPTLHPIQYKENWYFYVKVENTAHVTKMNKMTYELEDIGIAFD